MTYTFSEMVADIKDELEKSDLINPAIMVVETSGNGLYTHDPETYEVDILLGHNIEDMKKRASEIIENHDRGVWTVHNITLIKGDFIAVDMWNWETDEFR